MAPLLRCAAHVICPGCIAHQTGHKIRIDILVSSDEGSACIIQRGKFRCFQKLINLIPPHRVYIELTLEEAPFCETKRLPNSTSE